VRRFQKGDFAFASRHLVIIREVCGPMAEGGLDYAYLIERMDGEPFVFSGRSSPRIHAGQRELRPLGGTPRWKSRRARAGRELERVANGSA